MKLLNKNTGVLDPPFNTVLNIYMKTQRGGFYYVGFATRP